MPVPEQAKSQTPITKINVVELKKEEPRIHENWLKSYIEFTQYQESPIDFHLWIGISLIAGALNRNTHIQLGYKKLFPNLYIILISPSGRSKKSTATDLGIFGFLKRLDGPRIKTGKLTPEGLIEFLAQGPIVKNGNVISKLCTAFVYAPELKKTIGNQSYTFGLVEELTDLWDCRDEDEKTTKKGLLTNTHTRLENICLNMLGCSNPEWLAGGLSEDSFGGGFMSRVIFVYSELTNRTRDSAWMDIPPDKQGFALTLLKDLQRISKLNGKFEITNDAREMFRDIYLNYNGDFSGRMAAYYERKLVYALKLAMILSVNTSNNLVIDEYHIMGALKLLESVEKTMPKAFVYVGATSEAKIQQQILSSLQETGGSETHAILFKKVRHLVRNVRDFEEMLVSLTTAKLIRKCMIKDSEKIESEAEPGYSLIQK